MPVLVPPPSVATARLDEFSHFSDLDLVDSGALVPSGTVSI